MTPERMKWGILGLLVGDALGVPYEFTKPNKIPPAEEIEFEPPEGFDRAYNVPPGTWSDDGAQALCVLDAILNLGDEQFVDAVARRLLAWRDEGYLAVDGRGFDIGLTTNKALSRVAEGVPALQAGILGDDALSNGALMRTLATALFESDDIAARAAGTQAKVTHGEPEVTLVSCFYALWAKQVAQDEPKAWQKAFERLHELIPKGGALPIMVEHIRNWRGNPTGTGYILDSLYSAKLALDEGYDYESTVKRAVQFGNDTDTTAAIAGGIAGLKYQSIPQRWLTGLRGRNLLDPLLAQLASWTNTKT